MSVATFVRHDALVLGEGEKSFLFLIVALALVLAGPGRFSLDSAITRRSRTVR